MMPTTSNESYNYSACDCHRKHILDARTKYKMLLLSAICPVKDNDAVFPGFFEFLTRNRLIYILLIVIFCLFGYIVYIIRKTEKVVCKFLRTC